MLGDWKMIRYIKKHTKLSVAYILITVYGAFLIHPWILQLFLLINTIGKNLVYRLENKLRYYTLVMHLLDKKEYRRLMTYFYERASTASERVHTELRENPEYELPAGRPAFRPWGRSSKANILGTGHPIDKRFFFTECHLDVKVLWCDGHRAFLPTTARGAW